MAFDYSGIVDDADVLIDDMGQLVTLVIKSETPLSASQPWRGTAATEVTAAVYAVMVPFDAKDVDGTIVRRGDAQFIVAAKDLTAFNSESVDIIRAGSDNWGVVGVEIVNPGGTGVVFIFHGRK